MVNTSRLIENLITLAASGQTAPWQRPWSGGDSPRNRVTGRKYSGGNVLNLAWAQTLHDYPTSEWMTYKQAAETGAQVRRGEKSQLIEFWKMIPRKDASGDVQIDGAGNPCYRPMLTCFHVFNVAQIDGAEPQQTTLTGPGLDDQAVQAINDLYQRHGITWAAGGDRAYYRPATDEIRLPVSEAFKDGTAYATTALHEAGHWTGAAHRLARDGIVKGTQDNYAFEELVAELTAFIAATELGIGYDPQANGSFEMLNHGAYLAGWSQGNIERLRQAVPAAQKAAKYLIPTETPARVAI